MGPALRRWLGTAALVLASVALVLLALEVALRLFWGGYYVKFDETRPWGNLEFHPVRGWTPIPGTSVVGANEEYNTTLTHNSLGLRSPEIALAKPAGVTRVLVLGDSMTYGLGVEDDETYPAVLGALEPDLQVVNLGVQGYSGAQQLLMLRELGPRLDPDVVVLAFFWNDLSESYAPGYVHFELVDDQLRWVPPDPPTEDNPAFRDRNRRARRRIERYQTFWSSTYTNRFLSDRFKLLRARLEESFGAREDNFLDLQGEELEAAWRLTRAILREMVRETRALGARVVLLVLPDQTQVEPDVKVLGVPDYLPRVQERIAEFAQENDLPLVDLLPAFVERRLESGEPFYHRYDRHWNARAHRFAAEILREELARLGVAKGAPEQSAAATSR